MNEVSMAMVYKEIIEVKKKLDTRGLLVQVMVLFARFLWMRYRRTIIT